MKSIFRKMLLLWVATVWFGTAAAVPVFEDGSNDLQDVFTDLGLGYDVEADQSNHAYWSHSVTGSLSSFVFSDVNSFAAQSGVSVGVYSAVTTERMELFGDTMGSSLLTALQFNGDGSVTAIGGGGVFTSANTFGDVFGFYVTFGDFTYYSDPSMNPSYTAGDGNSYQDWAVMYQGDGSTMLNGYNGKSGGLFGTDDWLIAFDGSPNGPGQLDFNDAVFLMESIFPVPAPTALALMGLGLLGLAVTRRKQFN